MDDHSLHSPARLIITTMAMIFVAEALVMLLFRLSGANISILEGLLDASLLSLLIAPGMYIFLFKPMREQQRQILHSQQWLKSITEHLPEALISIDDEGLVHSFNPSAEQMFEYKASEIIGQNVNLLMGDQDAPEHDRYIRRYLDTGEARVIGKSREVEARRKSGKMFPIELQVCELLSGQHRYFLATIRDITERRREEAQKRQVEERIERTQRLESLGVLAGGIAHDFNNILSSMLGNAELLRMDLKDLDDEAENSLKNIETGCNHASDLCRQMLAYAGKGKYVIQPVHISELVKGMEQLIRVSIPKSVTMDHSLAADLPIIRADLAQMEQVVLNLLTNAAEAIGDKKGEIHLITAERVMSKSELSAFDDVHEMLPGVYVLIEVRDSGCGIEPGEMEHIFEPFFTTKFAGRGLGMSAILGILRSHGGGIHIDSVVGKGTTVQVLIPAVENGHDIPDFPDQEVLGEASSWRGSGKVLVVDDEQSVSRMARKMLGRMGFDALVSSDGQQALERLQSEKEPIPLVLLDMTMPGMSGLEILQQIRSNFPDVKVIISTGYGEQALGEYFGDCKPDGFVAKPYRYQQLLQSVHGILN